MAVKTSPVPCSQAAGLRLIEGADGGKIHNVCASSASLAPWEMPWSKIAGFAAVAAPTGTRPTGEIITGKAATALGATGIVVEVRVAVADGTPVEQVLGDR